MLAVSPLRNNGNDETEGEMERFSIGANEFADFCGGNLLDSIDFDDLFLGFSDANSLPDLEMDPEILAEFSVSADEESDINTSTGSAEKATDETRRKEEEDKVSGSGLCSEHGSGLSSSGQGEEIVSKRDEFCVAANQLRKEGHKGRKSSLKVKNSQGKRKVKVDWTPELHRRFVQAVEQLGVDKAVPSRILELMGIDCLTRHNIASHLQKYRSHRKHLLAREAEAASWSQRRQIYGAAAAGGGGGSKKDMKNYPWVSPTMGFPTITPLHPIRPLHVWGHPPVDQSRMHAWPKHLPSSPSPPSLWAQPPPPHPPSPDSSYWHPLRHHRAPNGFTPAGTVPCFPQPLAATRFVAPPVPGIPHKVMYKAQHGIGVPAGVTGPRPPFDSHPSKESIDAAIGDALSKPWVPLPLGLKPPSLDSVLVELQRQGISKIPPTGA